MSPTTGGRTDGENQISDDIDGYERVVDGLEIAKTIYYVGTHHKSADGMSGDCSYSSRFQNT